MMNKLKSLLKTGINKSIDDSGAIRRGIYTWLGRPNSGQTAVSFVPYGTFGNPEGCSHVVVLSMQGNESNAVGLDGDPTRRIKKNCKPGEFGIGNPLTGANTYFKEDGKIVTEADKLIVTMDPSGKLSIEGTADEIVSLIDEWMTAVIGLQVVTTNGLAPLSPAVITQLTAIQTRYQAFKV